MQPYVPMGRWVSRQQGGVPSKKGVPVLPCDGHPPPPPCCEAAISLNLSGCSDRCFSATTPCPPSDAPTQGLSWSAPHRPPETLAAALAVYAVASGEMAGPEKRRCLPPDPPPPPTAPCWTPRHGGGDRGGGGARPGSARAGRRPRRRTAPRRHAAPPGTVARRLPPAPLGRLPVVRPFSRCRRGGEETRHHTPPPPLPTSSVTRVLLLRRAPPPQRPSVGA